MIGFVSDPFPHLPGGISSKVRLFADDTALYLTIKGEEDSSALQKDLDTLSVWESKWEMQLNPSKCQVVQVTGSKSKKPLIQNIFSMDRSWRLSLVPDTLVLTCQAPYLGTLLLIVWSTMLTGPWSTSVEILK